MRIAVIAALVIGFTGVPTGAETSRQHPYREHWKDATFGKRALAGVGARAGISQALKRPRQWGGGLSGFGKRLGAGFAGHAIKTTVERTVAARLHEDLHYHRSTSTRFGPRLRHALVSTVVTHNTRTGAKRPAAGKISGHAAAGAFNQGLLHAGSGAATAGIGLGAEAGANVAREFWPKRRPALAQPAPRPRRVGTSAAAR